ncbi:hypothetical protein DB42_EL00080 [Neochlamydia sp. EPS4]|nr:hypothetical protein DB42_EL00080 [Neochlamydia sp. EPS4]
MVTYLTFFLVQVFSHLKMFVKTPCQSNTLLYWSKFLELPSSLLLFSHLNPNASNEERSIALIDHDFKVNRRNWKTIATSLMKLAKGELTEQIIKNLKTSINIRLNNDPAAAETYQEQLNQQGKTIKKCLEQGFHRGAQNLLQVCREPGVLSSLLEVSSSSNLSFPKEEFSDRVQIFTELLKIVKKHYS